MFFFQNSILPNWRTPKSRGETHLRVSQSQVAKSWDLEAHSWLPTLERGRGRVGSPGIRLGRWFSRSSLNLHQNKPPTWLVHIPGHPWVLGQATGILDHETHHGPDSGEATTIPHIIFSAPHFGDYIQMALFPGTPKLESRNCPETVPGGVLGLWALITPDCQVWSRRGLNQTCSPRRDLSNALSHSSFGGLKEVDSRLLVIGSQIASLTPGPSFAHNLGDRCPNGQCEAIFDIYASIPFQWNQEHPNARCFGPCCRTLNIRESRRTPTLHFFQVLGFTPHLAKVGLRHQWQPPNHITKIFLIKKGIYFIESSLLQTKFRWIALA
jgi:hypothetical protein